MNIQVRLTTKPKIQLYQHKEDRDVFGFIRPCATDGCPAVFVLNEPMLKVVMDKNWQYYLIAINYAMDLTDISSLLDYRLAFANQTGLRNPDHPRRDYILEKNLNAMENNKPAYPKLDKDRTCSRSLLTGIELESNLMLTLFDGNKPPPMKEGKPLPQTIAEINIDDYLYNPREHRWMFLVANTVRVKSGGNTSVAQFPRGGLYDWTEDNTPYSFMPHVSRETILYPLKYLQKLDMSKPLPSPYRIVTN